jgi:hypothetical protein
MRRYYSHYTFVYPDIYVKNFIVEMDGLRITSISPFDKEIEKTEFYSGLLVFLPDDVPFSREMPGDIKKKEFSEGKDLQWKNVRYKMYVF